MTHIAAIGPAESRELVNCAVEALMREFEAWLAAEAGVHPNAVRYWERRATEPYGVAVDLDAHGSTAIIERRQQTSR
jgi:hypothetical protein